MFLSINLFVGLAQVFTRMEGLIKKFQQRFRKVREEMDHWDVLQSRFISEFRNASSIIERLQVL